jgi:hypothetical protein
MVEEEILNTEDEVPPSSPGGSKSTTATQVVTNQEKHKLIQPRIEVTVQCVSNISTDDEAMDSNLRAAVAFAGSSPDMQVGSSKLCSLSGLVVFESEPAKENEAEWVETLDEDGRPRPHLTASTSLNDFEDKKRLLIANRDASEFVEQQRDIAPFQSPINSTSFWSDDACPEIVEFKVRFGECEGLAFLVFFGHQDDLGTTILDLPIRKPVGSYDGDNVFTDQSRLRVKVTVVDPTRPMISLAAAAAAAADDSVPPQVATCTMSTVSSGDEDKPVVYTRSLMEEQIAPLMKKIQEHENAALQLRLMHKRNNFVEHTVDDPSHDADRKKETTYTTRMSSFLHRLRHLVASCHESGLEPILGMSTDEDDFSTLSTEQSMEFFF